MKNSITSRTIDINALSGQEKEELIDEIYEVYTRIFRGWPRDVIRQLLCDKTCVLFKARLFLNNEGKAIGFAWVNGRYVNNKGKRYTIFHNMGGLDRTVRKSGLITSFFLSVLTRYRFSHPFEKIYSFQRLIHPAPYYAWFNALYEMYPRYNADTPPSVVDLTSYLNRVFKYRVVREENPFVVYTDNYVMISEEEKKRWFERQEPEIVFYNKLVEKRDDYSLVMIFSLDFRTGLPTLGKNILKGIRRKLRV